MSLTYEQFKELVPKETFEFVSTVLSYFSKYKLYNGELTFECGCMAYEEDKKPLLLLYCLSKIKEYGSFLRHYGFTATEYEIDDSKIKLQESAEIEFEENNRIFCIYEDRTLYASLQPLDIVVEAFEKYNYNELNGGFEEIFSNIFPNLDFDSFFEILKEKQQEKKEELDYDIEQQAYGELSSSVISYLETASKIRTLLFTTLKAKEKYVKLREEDIIPVSLLLAVYFYEDSNLFEEAGVVTTEQYFLQESLLKKGITADKIMNLIDVKFNECVVEEETINKNAISLLYTKYYRGERFQNVREKDKTVSQILEHVFMKSLNNSNAIKKILAAFHCKVEDFITIDKTVKKLKIMNKQNRYRFLIQSFYTDVPKDTIDFIEFATKTCLLLKEKLKKLKIEYTEEDMKILSLYISAFYHNQEINEFFKNYKITLEKILDFIHLSMTKEEIEKVKIDREFLIDHFREFVYEEKNKPVSQIHVIDLIYNLCQKDFNQSLVMENILLELAPSLNLYPSLSKYLQEKKQERIRDLREQLFKNISSNVIKYLENVSKIHQFFDLKQVVSDKTDIEFFSLLLGLFVSEETDIVKFLESKGITVGACCSYLKINFKDLLKKEINIEVLFENYKSYLFENENQNLEKKDITIFHIFKNLFSKDLCYSTNICAFLKEFNLKVEDFHDLENKLSEYVKKKEKEDKIREGKELINNFHFTDTKVYIQRVLSIYRTLMKQISINETFQNQISDMSDMKDLSIILGIFKQYNDIQPFLEKHQLTFKNICGEIGLNLDIFDDLEVTNEDFILLMDVYKQFMEYGKIDHTIQTSEFISKVFDDMVGKDSHIIEKIVTSRGVNYDILRKEIITRHDYELSLSIEERIELLSNEQVVPIDITDMKSILQFGDFLSFHSKCIHDELPKLMLSDVHDKSVEAINQIIDQTYTKVPVEKKKSIWNRLFQGSIEETKAVLNPQAIQELKETIDKNIDILSKELLMYASIRKYIEVYCNKTRSYSIIIEKELEKIEDKLKKLNSENEEEYASFLEINSLLQIMRDKLNRFNTSNLFMKQELFKVNQAIVNHFITINALEMARDDLLPLIGSELALMQGRNSENKALELSENIMELFQSLLSRNANGTIENLEKIKKLGNLSSETLTLLNKDIDAYLRELNQTTRLEQGQTLREREVLIEQEKEVKLPKEDKDKQKILEYPKQ